MAPLTFQPQQQRLRADAEAAAAGGERFSKLLYWNVGSGKGLGALHAAAALPGPAAAIAPAAVRPTLRGEAARVGRPDIPVVSYEGAAAGKLPEANTLLIDECLPAGSLVDGRPIESYVVGDRVLSFNHTNGRVEYGRITRTASRFTDVIAVVRFADGDDVACTPSHPFWTPDGYLAAEHLYPGAVTAKVRTTAGQRSGGHDGLQEDLPSRDYVRVRHTIYTEHTQAATEREVLFAAVSEDCVGGWHAQDDRQECPQDTGADADQQPHEGSGRTRAGQSHTQSARAQADSTRRERDRITTLRGGAVGCIGSGLDQQLCYPHWPGELGDRSVSEVLQDRHRASNRDASDRGRWPLAQGAGEAGTGREEDAILTVRRVDCVEVYERGSGPEFERLCPDGVVYDLTVEGNHNFFVAGCLVHNSQRLGSASSARALQVRDLAMRTPNVLLLSGTPVRNRPQEFAPLLSILTHTPVSHEEFAARYVGVDRQSPGLLARLRGVAPTEEPALVHTDELKRLLAGKVDYHAPATPPADVAHEDVEVELHPAQARLYHGMYGRLPFPIRWKLQHDLRLSSRELAAAQAFLHGPRQVALSTLPYRPDADPRAAFRESGKLQHAYRDLTRTLAADPRRKAVVYSNFPYAGLTPYAAALADAGVPHGTFHGGLSDAERKDLVDRFNRNELRVALVGPAGAEGISLKGAQLIQLLDEHWNQARTDQALARGIRLDSHRDLPPELQKVTVQHYVARLPLGPAGRLRRAFGADVSARQETTDDFLRRLSTRKQKLNNQLLDLLKEVGTKSGAAAAVPEPLTEKNPTSGVTPLDAVAATAAVDRFTADYVAADCPASYQKLAADDGGWESRTARGIGFVPQKRPAADAGRLGWATSRGRPKEAANVPSDAGLRHRPAPAGDAGREDVAATALVDLELLVALDDLVAPPDKAAAAPPALPRLLEAKARSDGGDYAGKVAVLRGLMAAAPHEWYVDSRSPDGYLAGVTHVSGFRLHVPYHQIADLAPAFAQPRTAS